MDTSNPPPNLKNADNAAPGARGPKDRHFAAAFSGWSAQQLDDAVKTLVDQSDGYLDDYHHYLLRGAYLAQSKKAFDRPREDGLALKEREQQYLKLERSDRRIDKFNQPWRLYFLIICCSLGAAVQGWDESAVNGAQIFYQPAFGIDGSIGLKGLINSAPYLCCTLSCWLNYPMNKLLGRRGTIFWTCLISSITCLGQAFPQTWQQLFVARLLLGFGIGPKSATIPIFAAECAPSNIRGALVMMWQMWTAFGIMCGYIAGVVLYNVGSGASAQCRSPDADKTILASAHCPKLEAYACQSVVVMYIYVLPESPRWLLLKAREGKDKRRYEEAFLALQRLRHTKLQAARDLFLINHLLGEEEKIMKYDKPFLELFTNGRNRRALTASVICMFMQQFCGINVLIYYSSDILVHNAHFKERQALLTSLGFGILNFVFALPAVWTIDSFGRRNLLLSTFPFMALSMLLVAISFQLGPATPIVGQVGVTSASSSTDTQASRGQVALLFVGMYLFTIFYSPGEGPVPFTYSAESMPLYNRDFGMGVTTSINWFFNFFLAITWPPFLKAFTPTGAFCWYAAWNVVGWFLIVFLVPETKDLSLEQLDHVFSIRTREHVAHGAEQISWFIRTYFGRQKGLRQPVLLTVDENEPRFVSPERRRHFSESYPMYDWEDDARPSAEASGRDSNNLGRASTRDSRFERMGSRDY
ncbi:hypothetical protein EJ05DRAFT_499609 [Pseudovirgaria hyperparasitica]|uniref:Major facilitator superfamily (MFS) profile domain-containing protein n=1 Tax=Pseudovirgaria hyperparasitica TaxID=470096 RepID=A0A6A6W8I3_9PEZI|nr:uncharacterized protein EJ05DRAFT_499609 [Pseudovirgaria hyperparasitica]KAF2759188.1 hypothetical protein EJ05DRAFT_499609 [Pseudovirgaria hyperparasitica]